MPATAAPPLAAGRQCALSLPSSGRAHATRVRPLTVTARRRRAARRNHSDGPAQRQGVPGQVPRTPRRGPIPLEVHAMVEPIIGILFIFNHELAGLEALSLMSRRPRPGGPTHIGVEFSRPTAGAGG
jgi:hypothetical protein